MTVDEQVEYWRDQIQLAVANELEHTSWVFDNFEQRIFSNIRFGFFRTEQQPHNELDWENTLEVNVAEVLAMEHLLLRNVYKEHGFKHRMFGPAMYELPKRSLVKVNFDYEDNLATVIDDFSYSVDINVDNFLQKWELRATLPICNVVFDIAHDRDIQEWQWEYIEAYEQWVQRLNETRRSKYIQIGGWADFRQDGDYYEYVAQIDTDHGDCGAIYLSLEAGKFEAYEQMC
jgi:hypothetical protein